MKIERVFISFVLSLGLLLTLRLALSSSTTQRAMAAQPDTARPSILSSPVLISDINPGTNSGLLTQFDSTQMITSALGKSMTSVGQVPSGSNQARR